MRALIQRVSEAHVDVEGQTIGKINNGVLILLGITQADTEVEARYLVEKITNLRIFEENGDGSHGELSPKKHFDKSLLEIKGEALVISQMTLYGNCTDGRRPDFTDVAKGPEAEKLYRFFIEELRKTGISVAEGKFGAMMDVYSVNRGPATFTIESRQPPKHL